MAARASARSAPGNRCSSSAAGELATDAPQQLLDDIQTDDVDLDEVLDYRGRYDSFSGALVGMKPPEFAVWMFAQLGARAGDALDDLYPGSGAIGRAWQLYASLEASQGPRDGSDPSRVSATEPSRLEPDDASRRAAANRPARQVDRRPGRVPLTTARASTT